MQSVCEIVAPCEQYDYILKCIIVGETCVGKTSILHRMTNQDFPTNPTPTIGIEFGTAFAKLSHLSQLPQPHQSHQLPATEIELNNITDTEKVINEKSTVIKLQIWDCAGQIRFRNIVRSYFRQAQIVFFVYDVNDYNTFKYLSSWIEAVDEQIGTENYVGCIIGNKNDLPNEQDVLLVNNLCETHPYLQYYTISAKEDGIENIHKIIIECIKSAYEKHENGKLKMEKPYWKSDKYIKLHNTDSDNTNCFGASSCNLL